MSDKKHGEKLIRPILASAGFVLLIFVCLFIYQNKIDTYSQQIINAVNDVSGGYADAQLAVNDFKYASFNAMLVLAAELTICCALLISFVIRQDKHKLNCITVERERLRQSEELYRTLVETSENVILDAGMCDGQIHFNKEYEQVFHRPPFLHSLSDLEKRNPFVPIEDADAYQQAVDFFKSEETQLTIEFRLLTCRGEYHWHRATLIKLLDNKKQPYRIICKLKNVDTQKRQLAQLKEQAENDSLTKLLNHATFQRKVESYLQNEGKHGCHALMVLDIDDFKSINDSQGHITGDNILRMLSAEIRRNLRGSDLTGRLGGDEFGILIKDMATPDIARAKAESICGLFTLIGERGTLDIPLSASIGVAIYGSDGANFEELYSSADSALYEAKALGKNCYVMHKS